jgi:hypothetical protein
MRNSAFAAFAALAVPVLVAGSLLAGTAQAQAMMPAGSATSTTTTTNTGTPVGSPGMLTVPPNTGNTVTGAPAATTTETTTMTNNTTMPAGGIGSGMRPGVGPPIGGLDSNPYAEAPQAARALGYPYHPPGSSGSTARSTE